MSAVHAMEDALGVSVDGPLRDLRRLLYCGEWIESHALHIYMLHAPDFLGYDGAIDMARDHGDVVQRGLAAEEDRQRDHDAARRARDPSDQRARRRLLQGAAPARARAAGRAAEVGARRGAGDGALGRRLRLSRLRARLRIRRAAPPRRISASTRAASSRTAGSTSTPRDYDAHFEESHVARSNALHSRLRERRRLSGRAAGALQPELRPPFAARAARRRARRGSAAPAPTRSAASSCARSRCSTPATRRCASSRPIEEPDQPFDRRRAARRRRLWRHRGAARACSITAIAWTADGTIARGADRAADLAEPGEHRGGSRRASSATGSTCPTTPCGIAASRRCATTIPAFPARRISCACDMDRG